MEPISDIAVIGAGAFGEGLDERFDVAAALEYAEFHDLPRAWLIGWSFGTELALKWGHDPLVEGVACHYTTPERGGISGTFGVAEEVSDISLSCRQVGPVKFTQKFGQGDVVFSERRSLIFKKMQIVRGCDAKRNTLVYMVYSDRPIEGSPKNSTPAALIRA